MFTIQSTEITCMEPDPVEMLVILHLLNRFSALMKSEHDLPFSLEPAPDLYHNQISQPTPPFISF
jgi:hypothetical protein